MRHILYSFLALNAYLFSTQTLAKDCIIDNFFQKSIQFNSYSLDIEELDINRNNNIKTMLPDINIGLGQYINNNQWFSSLTDSNFYLSLSYNLLSAYEAKMQNDKLNVANYLKYIEMLSERNNYIINLFSEVIDYKIKKSHLMVMRERYKKFNKEYEIAKHQMSVGLIPVLDAEMRYNILQKIRFDINVLEEEEGLLSDKISREYYVPENAIPDITYNKLKECKTADFYTLLAENNRLKIKTVGIDNDIRRLSEIPSFYLSFGLTPKQGGALGNMSLRKMDYSASLGISFPLVGLFSSSENQKEKIISMSRTRNESLKENIKLELLEKEIRQKIDRLEKNLAVMKNELTLKRRKVEYINYRVKNGQDDVITYLSSVENLHETENEFQKIGYEIEYYRLYHYFLLQHNSSKGKM
ncbi:dispersin export ABC transporter outer membrane protein AatA [Escherichia coli]|uniref:dispersin export ABC transporter outer membrane protein AatA n=1 Tax=Escherichia coli TaxID=562 RepID=UPI0004D5FEAE|nr:dispersin export ABC transporter outer membrane protein AatA [Escherichia coli]EKY9160096.1 dispersin export ABC transporter outer membrane protein AatA [Escherichia coli]ELG6564181.1 dispersin export ABC transporter outer membrane protein AatA [Escherichia coli]KDY14252.1 putative aatA outermembrane protein [Escherichia coli 2-316-03_S4_C2]MDA6733082.1 dispersin export ABC transporter outer membrane protein AatA [Escherichia coli]MDO2707164.1 dispersin export ABC transporter outer membrane